VDAEPTSVLSEAKRALLERHLATRARKAIPRRTSDKPAPLSFAQERLWLLEQLLPDVTAYNVPRALRIPAELDPRALQSALDAIAARHEVLRTRVEVVDGAPVQTAGDDSRVELSVVDLRGRAPEEAEREALRVAVEVARRPFRLTGDLLIRAALAHIGRADDLLLIVTHHLASDEGSRAILLGELAELYDAALKGRQPQLADLPVQYADFAAWQRAQLDGPRMDTLLSYWTEALAGAPQALELPADHARPPVQSYRGARRQFQLPADLLNEIKGLARALRATPFMVLLAAFETLLTRYAGVEDLVIGTPVSGRDRPETEALIGFFTNTLVLRTSTEGDPTFAELVGRVQAASVAGLAHRELPFERLVDALNPERTLARAPVFQVFFIYESDSARRYELAGVPLRPLTLDLGWAKFDLSLAFGERPDGSLSGLFEYSTDLFVPDTIERAREHLERLLRAAVRAPETRLAELPLVGAGERERVLAGWGETAEDDAIARPVHQLIEAQVERSPNACALVFGGEELTYRELDDRANRLARRLRTLGVGPDVVVGVCLPRSLDLVVAILAVLKAGGAYAPLDPAYPAERLTFMLADTAAPVLLTNPSLAEELPATGASVIAVGEGVPELDAAEVEPLSGPDDLAYVLYTSGSTGQPKGVPMPHAVLANLLEWQRLAWEPPNAARTLQFAALSFDVASQEILATLAFGGTLVLVDEETRRDPEALLRLLVDAEVERLFVPFVALQHLAEASVRLQLVPGRLREVMTAGEALQITPAIREFFAHLDGAVLHNQYGPTESHVVTEFTLSGDPAGWPTRPPIGRPIANARIAVLDAHGAPAPIGVPGELHIGGRVLARGYLNRPDLTAERFVADPFGGPGDRLYRTGDRARFLASGELEYLGRLDDQVKVRGFRVEPGEVESVLALHSAVNEAVVVAHEHGVGDRRLTAYLVADRRPNVVRDVRAFLREKLPEHLVPSTFVFLDALPLTPSGKVDRRSLPPPGQAEQAREEEIVPPQTPLEETLATIMGELVGVEQVGSNESFFDLGGYSLLAMQLVSRIRDDLGVELPLRAVYEYPRVAELAGAVARRLAEGMDEDELAELLAEIDPAPR
jgi:amino acid adenylation domain-containing protein